MDENEAGMAWFESSEVCGVTFHPRSEWGPGGEGDGFEELRVPVAPGVRLGARLYAAENEQVAILFFHGNGEIVADYADIAPFFVRQSATFVPVDYRGYGRSGGRPGMATMLSDAVEAFGCVKDLLEKRGGTQRIVVMGRSLGSASALELASRFSSEVAGLIIDSGFADAIDLLVRLGAPQPGEGVTDVLFQHERKIAEYVGPTLIIHGVRDYIIPFSDAEALFRAAGSDRKRFVPVEDAGHNDILMRGFDEYMSAIGALLEAVCSGVE